MSERGSFRGGRGRGGGGGGYARGGQSRGGGGGGAGGQPHQQQQQERPKKENILDLSKYMDKEVKVKFSGGREGMRIPICSAGIWSQVLMSYAVSGTLKGFDQLMNLVLDEVKEAMRGMIPV